MIISGLQLALLIALSAPPPPHGEAPRPKGTASPMIPIPGSKKAIDAALDRIYPSTQDLRFGMQPEPGETEAPLSQVVAYRATLPVPHWHYVTYGLTELEEKVSTDATLSGFGVEYSLRLVDDSPQPPVWPINLLRYLAKLTWETQHPYDPGHSMNLPKQMLEEYSKGIEGLAFFEDEQLRPIDTPSGRITFVNVVPLMAGEYALISSWDAFKIATEIRTIQHDFLWRAGRKSILESPRARAIQALVETEGSSQSVDFVELICEQRQIVLDSVGAFVFETILRHRLAHGRDAKLIWGERVTQVSPGNWQFTFGKDSCQVHVPADQARALADEISKARDGALIKRAGGLKFRIDRSN